MNHKQRKKLILADKVYTMKIFKNNLKLILVDFFFISFRFRLFLFFSLSLSRQRSLLSRLINALDKLFVFMPNFMSIICNDQTFI